MGLDRLSSKKVTVGQQVCEKVFNIINHQGTQNEAVLRCCLTPVRVAVTQRWRIISGGREGQEPWYTPVGMHISMAILEGSAEAPEKIKYRTPTALGIYSKDMNGVLLLCIYFSVIHNSQGIQAL